MQCRSVLHGCRSATPLAAFLSLATLATLLAAQALLACSRQVTIAMPEMPGMNMAAMPMPPGAVSLCPIVIALGVIGGVLSLNAFVLLLLDPNRASTGRSAARLVVRLPFAGTCGIILAFGCGAVGMMIAIDGTVPGSSAAWLSLGGIVLAVTIAAALVAVALGKFVLTISRRVGVALQREIQIVRRSRSCVHLRRPHRIAHLQHSAPILAACRGLRAPPFLVR
jgi:hypothetical protein